VSELDFLSPTRASVSLRTPMAGAHSAPLREREGWLLPDYPPAGDAPVWISDASQLGKIEVRGPTSELDAAVGVEEPCTTRRDGEAWVARMTPTRALVLCPSDEMAARLDAFGSAAVDMTCAWAALRVGGPQRLELFARLSDLDVRPRVFPAGAVASGPVAECAGIVVNEGDALLLLVGWEYGAYLWHSALDMGEPLGVVPA
jgi:sarcosine oxidase gamma subunit